MLIPTQSQQMTRSRPLFHSRPRRHQYATSSPHQSPPPHRQTQIDIFVDLKPCNPNDNPGGCFEPPALKRYIALTPGPGVYLALDFKRSNGHTNSPDRTREPRNIQALNICIGLWVDLYREPEGGDIRCEDPQGVVRRRSQVHFLELHEDLGRFSIWEGDSYVVSYVVSRIYLILFPHVLHR